MISNNFVMLIINILIGENFILWSLPWNHVLINMAWKGIWFLNSLCNIKFQLTLVGWTKLHLSQLCFGKLKVFMMFVYYYKNWMAWFWSHWLLQWDNYHWGECGVTKTIFSCVGHVVRVGIIELEPRVEVVKLLSWCAWFLLDGQQKKFSKGGAKNLWACRYTCSQKIFGEGKATKFQR